MYTVYKKYKHIFMYLHDITKQVYIMYTIFTKCAQCYVHDISYALCTKVLVSLFIFVRLKVIFECNDVIYYFEVIFPIPLEVGN